MDHERQHQLARNIHFACSECQSRLHLTSFPRQIDFSLACPCCKRRGKYNLHQLLDDALEEAVRNASYTEVCAALVLGADVDTRVTVRGSDDPRGSALDLSPIGYAVSKRQPGFFTIARRLVEEKADLDVVDHRQRTLLVNAVHHDDRRLFDLLIENGASPHQPTMCENRQWPLHATFQNRRHHPNLEVMRVLLDAGASAQVCDGAGNSVLRYAWCSGDELAVGVVMKALNWHLHAPESLRPRKAPAQLPTLGSDEPLAKPTTTRADLSAPPPPPPVAGEAGAAKRPAEEEADDAPAAAADGGGGEVGAALAAAIAEDDAEAPPPSTPPRKRNKGAAAAPEAAGELPRWEWQQPGPEQSLPHYE